jgi:hypothetical protein
MKATSRSFVVNPALLGPLARARTEAGDRFSTEHLLASAAAIIRDVAVLSRRARAVDERLATFTMDCEIRFVSPTRFRSFSEELASALATLAVKYDRRTAKSRRFRVVVGSHPVVTKSETAAAAEAARHQRTHRRNIARSTP